MPIFQSQLANVVEWNEKADDVIFWKWSQTELKKGSRLIIRPGQDAIFLYNGRIEGVFTDEGNYEIESQILPFLSTLKGFKFGFNSGLRAEVVFVNVREFTVKWGTKNAIALQAAGLPGGLPVRAHGMFTLKVSDYIALIDKIAGIQRHFTVDDVRERVLLALDGLLMTWIAREGRDMFNLQAQSAQISEGIRQDLDMQMTKIGLSVTGFSISSFTYPEEIQKRINQQAGVHMVGDTEKYQRVSLADSMTQGRSGSAGDTAASMAGMMAGMQMAREMVSPPASPASTPAGAKFCAHCGKPLAPGGKFCPECGSRVG